MKSFKLNDRVVVFFNALTMYGKNISYKAVVLGVKRNELLLETTDGRYFSCSYDYVNIDTEYYIEQELVDEQI